MNQTQAVLRGLHDAPICGVNHNWRYGARLSARIFELRGAGFDIGRRRCQEHDHETTQWEYFLSLEQITRGSTDWCWRCGPGSEVRHTWGCVHQDGGSLLKVRCRTCGKGDWR